MGKHSEWRKLAKKARRKRIRQKLAQERDEVKEAERKQREQSPTYARWLNEQKKLEEYREEEELRLAKEAEEQWLKAEVEAQKQWQELQKRLELAREERIKQNELIKAEWETEQQRLKKIEEKKLQEAEEHQRRQELLNEQIENYIDYGGDIPQQLNRTLETNPNKEVCPFFKKTGACRFSDTCSRNHIRPGISRIVLIPNFYSHISLEQSKENEYGTDTLEFEAHETYNHFKEFFYDVFPEFEKCGQIRQFKVCCNQESHLRGNVYVEYSSRREAIKSYRTFQGRWYGGKQLNIEFCQIRSWKSAICGLFFKKTCPKGTSCNFLHVFQNPGKLFHNADKDLHRTPPSRDTDSTSKNWRWSESPERLRVNHYDDISEGDEKNSKRCRTRENGKSHKHKSRRRRSRSRSHKKSDRSSRSDRSKR